MDRVISQPRYQHVAPLAVARPATLARSNAHERAILVHADGRTIIRACRQHKPTICS